MRTETITAGDGRSIRLVVPPLPGQCWEAMRIQSATARSGAALGLLLAAGGIESPGSNGRPWRPLPLAKHRGSMEEWGYSVWNAVKAHTGWGVVSVSALADAALVLMTDTIISGEEVDRAAGFFSAPFLEKLAEGEE